MLDNLFDCVWDEKKVLLLFTLINCRCAVKFRQNRNRTKDVSLCDRAGVSHRAEEVFDRLTQSMGTVAAVHFRMAEILEQLDCASDPIQAGFYGCVLDHVSINARHQAALNAAKAL